MDGRGIRRCKLGNTQTLYVVYRRSDYDSEEEEDDTQPRKPVPDWARGRALVVQLLAQQGTDPDEVFQQHKKTLCLDDVFDKSSASRHRRTHLCSALYRSA